ncbi:hypothetical protein SDJN03_17107, partial [Cucurbita argyrosperma subsp. sororia]
MSESPLSLKGRPEASLSLPNSGRKSCEDDAKGLAAQNRRVPWTSDQGDYLSMNMNSGMGKAGMGSPIKEEPTPWHWTREDQEAFEDLESQGGIMADPVLAFQDHAKLVETGISINNQDWHLSQASAFIYLSFLIGQSESEIESGGISYRRIRLRQLFGSEQSRDVLGCKFNGCRGERGAAFEVFRQ